VRFSCNAFACACGCMDVFFLSLWVVRWFCFCGTVACVHLGVGVVCVLLVGLVEVLVV